MRGTPERLTFSEIHPEKNFWEKLTVKKSVQNNLCRFKMRSFSWGCAGLEKRTDLMVVAGDDGRPLLPLLVLQLIVQLGDGQILVTAVVRCQLAVVLLVQVLLRLERLLAAALVRLPRRRVLVGLVDNARRLLDRRFPVKGRKVVLLLICDRGARLLFASWRCSLRSCN